uniref:Reverse transcriptase domain-containing protein n=1 Tax=Schistosoma curassoni TaxID=6186 RepID=A0A183L3Z5_9TREM
MKDAVDAQLRDQQAGFRKDRCAQTKLRHYGLSLNNQLSETRHYTSTSLIMKRHLTVLKTLGLFCG